ncbi:MAG: site-specific DNA-methyltransferase [Deltaproteobacteria bacterium]|nr:site-specific DNA-methyltransferase [Deltaproteobacteria bacterium]
MKKLTKEDGSSPDVVADNIEKLREIFPEVFADGCIDFHALRQTLGENVDDREERYSFTWHGKSRARQIAQMPSAGTLLPCPEESVNWDTTKNIFIEGDNLEVLKLLQKSYHRKVKMIYIDPPYNTGKEFIYPDKWQDNLDTYLRYTGQVDDEGFKLSANSETSGRYHTNWLNMMYPRLKLARNLLRDDGVIFVSIDDHEVQNLRYMLDEIFGSENFYASIAWQKRDTTAADARGFSVSHEYVVMYRRTESFKRNLLPRTPDQEANYKNPDDDLRGPWIRTSLIRKQVRENRLYEIENPSGRRISPPAGTSWRLPPEKFEELTTDGRIWWGVSRDGNLPFKKSFLSEVQQGVVPITWWDHKFAGSNRTSKVEIRDLFGGKVPFDTPKPTRLIKQMLHVATAPGDLVMDFFAGSGTTGHAALDVSAGTERKLRFLLVQLPEVADAGEYATISDVAKARLRAAGGAVRLRSPLLDQGIGSGSLDLGFKVFKLSSSNIKPWDADFDTMDQDLVDAIDNIKSDRSEDDVLYELLLKYGLDLAIPTESRDIEGRRVTVIGAGALIVCLADDITLEVVSGIAALREELKPEVMRVVFKDSGFADDVAKTNAAQILEQAGIDDVKSL